MDEVLIEYWLKFSAHNVYLVHMRSAMDKQLELLLIQNSSCDQLEFIQTMFYASFANSRVQIKCKFQHTRIQYNMSHW